MSETERTCLHRLLGPRAGMILAEGSMLKSKEGREEEEEEGSTSIARCRGLEPPPAGCFLSTGGPSKK